MIGRINKIMELEQMSPSRFADAIGIQRSALSHIQSGRNKVSFDVFVKILERFPHVAPDWLLFGKGEMLRESAMNELGSLAEQTEGAQIDGVLQKTLGSSIDPNQKIAGQMPHVIEKIVEREVPQRRVSRIMIFYTDNTFETFVLDKAGGAEP